MITTQSRRERVEAILEALNASDEWEHAVEDQRTEALAQRFEAARLRRIRSGR